MSNFYTDNQDLVFTLKNLDLEEVVAIREHDYTDAQKYDGSPENFADAMDNYDRVLTVVGDVAGERIAPRSRQIDEEGPHFENGVVTYHPLTVKNLEDLRRAGVSGVMLPRKYDGLNFPTTIYTMMTEMVSRADASLQNLFGLQDIAETISEFGNEEQRQRFLPRFACGEADGRTFGRGVEQLTVFIQRYRIKPGDAGDQIEFRIRQCIARRNIAEIDPESCLDAQDKTAVCSFPDRRFVGMSEHDRAIDLAGGKPVIRQFVDLLTETFHSPCRAVWDPVGIQRPEVAFHCHPAVWELAGAFVECKTAPPEHAAEPVRIRGVQYAAAISFRPFIGKIFGPERTDLLNESRFAGCLIIEGLCRRVINRRYGVECALPAMRRKGRVWMRSQHIS